MFQESTACFGTGFGSESLLIGFFVLDFLDFYRGRRI